MADSLQTLQPEIVCQITEALMLTHGAATVQDVRRELREQGFLAAPAEVSAYMSVLAEERDWWFWSEGRELVYTFGEDTDETVCHYMENAKFVWQVLVRGRQQIVAEGRIGKMPELSYQQFPSNRHAMAHAYGSIMIQESLGYVSMPVKGLSLHHLYDYRHYLSRKPKSCILSFREGEQTEVFSTVFSLNNQRATGRMLIEKKVGYAVSLTAETAAGVLKQHRKDHYWVVPPAIRQAGLLLGEKIIHSSAYLASGERLADWTISKQAELPDSVVLKLPLSGIYKVELAYNDGSRLELDYRDFSGGMELWLLAEGLML